MDKNPRNSDTVEITEKINKKLCETGKSIELNLFDVLKDDIRNYRQLNDFQKHQIDFLTEKEKIEIIRLYDIVISSMSALIMSGQS